MQIINGYSSADDDISKIFKFRLYHLNHPRLANWRRSRHGHQYQLDVVEQYTIEHCKSTLVAVDCAGWIYNSVGIDTQCIEELPTLRHFHTTRWTIN